MFGKPLTVLALALVALVGTSACGSVATPEWAADVQSTRVAQAATVEHLTAIAPTSTPLPPTATPTALPPTATLIPPTATPLPPTETPLPTEPPAAEAGAQTAGEDPVAVALAAGDPVAGQAVFQATHPLPDGQTPWACSSCHSVDPAQLVMIGPGLYNIRDRAAQRIEGQNAVEYIYNSIVNPQDYIAPIPEGSPLQQWAINMPHGFGEVLTEQELNNVIAYLLTLHD